jgi:hypothetical protein
LASGIRASRGVLGEQYGNGAMGFVHEGGHVHQIVIADAVAIAALYETFLRSSPTVQNATGVVSEISEERDRQGEVRQVLFIQGSLFE